MKSAKISKGEAVTSVAGLRNEEASRADVGALPPAAGHVTEDFRSERRPAPQISASPKRWQLARERERQGLIVLQIVVGDAHVSALLTGAGYLDPLKADDKKAIARALERYIAAGRVAEFDV
ncbi:hypothetical protein [Mesorhizobium sp.]|uniref:hypothetical protein n=1 Tax=Mesorhizobium sp. TaxID=1871066 RepID=UPI0025BC8F23|nr:hypothetical protein [Mesorhizobium sp.]